jgi:hypothetical protein
MPKNHPDQAYSPSYLSIVPMPLLLLLFVRLPFLLFFHNAGFIVVVTVVECLLGTTILIEHFDGRFCQKDRSQSLVFSVEQQPNLIDENECMSCGMNACVQGFLIAIIIN